MDRTERFHLIDQMLCNSSSVNRQRFLDTLEVSAATFKRDLEYMRDRLGAPIVPYVSSIRSEKLRPGAVGSAPTMSGT